MSADKKRFKLNIAGKNYVVIGDSTPEHMQTVARLTDEQLKEIMHSLPQIKREDAAVLLALNAVSDQIKKQNELDKLKEKNDNQEQ